MSVNSGLKATKIIGQRKAFYRQRIPEFSCARKETVDIDILVTSRNRDRKTMQSIRIMSRPQMEPVEPVLKNIYQSKTYRKRLKLATLRRSAKGSREAASEGTTILHICSCSLSNKSK